MKLNKAKKIKGILRKLICPEAKDLYLVIALAGGSVEFGKWDHPILGLADLIDIEFDVVRNKDARERVIYGLQILQDSGLIKVEGDTYTILPKL